MWESIGIGLWVISELIVRMHPNSPIPVYLLTLVGAGFLVHGLWQRYSSRKGKIFSSISVIALLLALNIEPTITKLTKEWTGYYKTEYSLAPKMRSMRKNRSKKN